MFLRIFIVSTLLILTLGSCKKRTESDTDTSAAKDNAMGDQAYSKINTRVVSISIKEEGVNKSGANPMTCATVTVSSDTIYPKQIVIDYGSGCQEMDGAMYAGMITAQISAPWTNSGSVITYQLNGFSVNGVTLHGTVQITNNGNNSYTSIVSSGICIGGGRSVTYSSDRTVRWIAGMSTDTIPSDDIYEVTGSSLGTGSSGKTFATVIMVALRVEASCRWITAGQVSVTPSGSPTRTIDFGNGGCDSEAVVTINGSDYKITLD